MRRILIVASLLAFAAPALAQHEESATELTSEHGTDGHAAEHGGHHQSELDRLGIHSVGDLFVVPADASEEIREERAHLRQQLIAAFVNFGLLLVLFFGFALKGINASLAERRAGIAKDLEEAARLKAEAEAKHLEYKKRLEQLDAELAAIRAEMQKAGEAERDRIVLEAEKKAERLRKENEFLIEQRFKTLREDLTREAAISAIAAAETVLREKTTADDQQRLSRAYVAGVGEAAKEGRA